MIQNKVLSVGKLAVNCYILWDGNVSVVIDPGSDGEEILSRLKCPLKAILLTHGHFDHIGAAAFLKEKTNAPIYMHKADFPMVADSQKNLSFMTGEKVAPFEANFFVEDSQILNFGEMSFKVLHTPGHSAGGVCYVLGKTIFGGDLIFYESIGRFDYGNYSDEITSVKRVLASFDDDYIICPGHGIATDIGHEKNYNPYI